MKKITRSRLNPGSLRFNAYLFIMLCMLLFAFKANGQVFWTEAFQNSCSSGCFANTYVGPNGAWTQTATGANDPEANKWFVSGAECGNNAGSCGSTCGTVDPSLHIGADDGFVFDPGAAYDAGGLCGFFACVATDMRAESPTINCSAYSTITLSFNYIENGQTTIDDATLWYFDGATWSLLVNLPKTLFGSCSPQGLWTAFSIAMPASANNNPNVKIGFRWVNNDDGVGTDPSFAVDDITLSVPVSSNTITTGTITGSPFCACSAVNVPFTSTGTFTAGNVYTAQLSDAAGSFAAPVTIGTLVSTANAGTIAATIPCGTPTGSGYRIRVISSTPAIIGTDNGVNITITQPSVATFSYTGTPYCQNASNPSPTFSGGGVAGTFSSTAGLVFVSTATGQVDLASSTAGTYTVTNTIAATGGCPAVTATSSITITAVQSAAFSYSGSTFCSSGSNPVPTITGTAGGTFSSSPAGLVFVSTSTGEINVSTSTFGTYTVTYTTPGPCPGTASTSVTITTNPIATFTYAGPYCQTDPNPSPTFTGGGSAGTFTASPAGLVFVSSSTGQVDLASSAPGTYTVTNTIAASGGCPASSATATITIEAPPVATFDYGGPFCQSDPDPSPNFTGGGTAGTFTSTAGLSINSTTGVVSLSGSTPGTYIVTNTVAGSGACATGTDTATITITAPPVATFSYAGPYCQNDPDPSPTYSGGGVAGTFTSTAGLSLNASTGAVSLSGSTPGTYTVTNTIAASGGCPAVTATATITINAAPTVTVTSAVICSGQTATLTASGATTYTWSAGATGSGSTATASPTTTTSYTVTGTTSGCTGTAVAVVTVNPCNEPVANFSADQTVFCNTPACVNFTDLSTNTPTSWSWSFPGASPSSSTSQNPTNICYSTNGSFDVTLIATNSSGSDTLTMVGYITIGAPVVVTISGNLVINACEGTNLFADPNDGTYAWGPNVNLSASGSTAHVTPPATQDYYVTYTSPQGCTDSDTVTVVVEQKFAYYMPTAFSPNNDGINDVLQVQGKGIDYINLRIYDRIGEKVFDTTDPEQGWDGKLLGLPMNDAVFVYKLEVVFCNGDTAKEQGALILAR